MVESKYYCKNCGTQIKSRDTICPKCGKNLSEVGRRIEKTITETIGLSDNVSLAKRITGSLVNVSGDIAATSSLMNAIPKEKQEEIGINEEFLKTLKNIEQNTKHLAEIYRPPYVTINADNIIGPIQVSQEGNNIVVTTNIDESFNGIYQEIEKMNVDSSIKVQAKLITNELKEEIVKEKPDKGKILKMWDEFKILVPLVAPIVAPIISKVLLG
jgi:DNA-directed RNA polymerase subunit RPC12/RpoP